MFAILGTLLSGLFGKYSTVAYPLKPREVPSGLRGHVEVDIDLCIFCGMCRRKCPTEAIDVSREGKSWAIERFRCVQCGSCVEVCPKKCIYMHASLSPVSVAMTKEITNARISTDTTDNQNR